jgi:hypothetical protein
LPRIVSVSELVGVTLAMLGRNMQVDALDAALDVRPKGFDLVGAYIAVGPLVLAVVNCGVLVLALNTIVYAALVTMDYRAPLDGGANERQCYGGVGMFVVK